MEALTHIQIIRNNIILDNHQYIIMNMVMRKFLKVIISPRMIVVPINPNNTATLWIRDNKLHRIVWALTRSLQFNQVLHLNSQGQRCKTSSKRRKNWRKDRGNWECKDKFLKVETRKESQKRDARVKEREAKNKKRVWEKLRRKEVVQVMEITFYQYKALVITKKCQML